MREISLSNSDFFELAIGDRVLKKDVRNSEGDIPVYSANVFEPFGYLKESNLDDFDHDYILWGIDGNFELNVKYEGEKFATTDHCGTIKILDDRILPDYALHALEIQKHKLGFDRNFRPNLTNMRKVSIELPEKNGEIDLDAQQDLVERYQSISSIKEYFKGELEEIRQMIINIDLPTEEIITVEVNDLFDLSISTNSSSFTKTFVQNNPGSIPVYSPLKNRDEVNYGFVEDNLDGVKYFEDCLTWNIDGAYAGKAFYREGRFSLSEKVIPLLLEDQWEDKIDYLYVKYVLEKKAAEMGFGYSHKAGKSRISDIEIEIPVKQEDGKKVPDLERQKELAERYETTYQKKQTVISSLEDLSEITVELSASE